MVPISSESDLSSTICMCVYIFIYNLIIYIIYMLTYCLIAYVNSYLLSCVLRSGRCPCVVLTVCCVVFEQASGWADGGDDSW